MPSFADQLDDRQRWDLATYIAGFSADPAAAKSEKSYNIADLARQTQCLEQGWWGIAAGPRASTNRYVPAR